MYFKESQRYFDRNGEYEVVKVLPSGSIRIKYQEQEFTTIVLQENLDIKQVIDVHVRAERSIFDFIDYCRVNGSIYADISRNQLEQFCSRYELTTGRKLKPVYGVYVRKSAGNNCSLGVILPSSVLRWMPSNFHGSWKEAEHNHIHIYNTAFVWTLLDHGMLLGSKHRKPATSTKKDSTLPRTNFSLLYGVGREKFTKLNISIQNNQASLYKDELVENYKFGRIKNEDGSISPAQDTGFRFNRGTWPAALIPNYWRIV